MWCRATYTPGGLLGIFLLENLPWVFDQLRCLVDTWKNMGYKIHGFFQYFYIQTKLKVNRNQNCLSTNIFNIQNDAWFLWQLWKLKSFAIIAFSNRKKYDWIFILKEIISWYVSVTCIVSYLHKNEEFDQAIILLNLHAASFLNGRVVTRWIMFRSGCLLSLVASAPL